MVIGSRPTVGSPECTQHKAQSAVSQNIDIVQIIIYFTSKYSGVARCQKVGEHTDT